MNTKRLLKVMPVVATLLLTTACSNEDNEVIENKQSARTITIPYEVSVSNGNTTRATLGGDEGNVYQFQEGDALYVWGTNSDDETIISGVLTLNSGKGTSHDASFKGELTYNPGKDDPATPADNLYLNSVLKSTNDEIIGSFDASNNNYQPTYTNTIATATETESSNAVAVQKYSYFTGSSNFGDKSFTLYQQSAFVPFDITLVDGTTANTSIDVTVSSGSGETAITRSGTVKTVEEGGVIKAKFTAAFANSTQLTGATIKLGERALMNFASQNPYLTGGYKYPVTKTYRYKMTIKIGDEERYRGFGNYNYTVSLADALSSKPTYAAALAFVTDCTSSSPDPSTDNISVSGTKPNYVFTAKEDGETTFIVTIGALTDPVTVTLKTEDLKPKP